MHFKKFMVVREIRQAVIMILKQKMVVDLFRINILSSLSPLSASPIHAGKPVFVIFGRRKYLIALLLVFQLPLYNSKEVVFISLRRRWP